MRFQLDYISFINMEMLILNTFPYANCSYWVSAKDLLPMYFISFPFVLLATKAQLMFYGLVRQLKALGKWKIVVLVDKANADLKPETSHADLFNISPKPQYFPYLNVA